MKMEKEKLELKCCNCLLDTESKKRSRIGNIGPHHSFNARSFWNSNYKIYVRRFLQHGRLLWCHHKSSNNDVIELPCFTLYTILNVSRSRSKLLIKTLHLIRQFCNANNLMNCFSMFAKRQTTKRHFGDAFKTLKYYYNKGFFDPNVVAYDPI